LLYLCFKAGGVLLVVLVEGGADLGGDESPGSTGRPSSSSRPGWRAAEQVLHVALAVSLAVSKK
jgi:hypothetical protein